MSKHLLLTALMFVASFTISLGQEILLLKTSGKVVVGDTSQISTPDGYNMFVQNGILTEKVKVAVKSSAEWSDDAWESTPTISEVAASIKSERHLPAMPSADELVTEGYDIQKMDAKLLAQIEWLWQHMIVVTEENAALKQEIARLSEELKAAK